MASDVFTQVSYLGLVGYDLSHLLNIKEIDPLAVSIFYVLACSSIAASLLLILVSFRIIEKNIKENITGCLGYLLFFVLYQVFWLGSLYNLVFKKKVKWR